MKNPGRAIPILYIPNVTAVVGFKQRISLQRFALQIHTAQLPMHNALLTTTPPI